MKKVIIQRKNLILMISMKIYQNIVLQNQIIQLNLNELRENIEININFIIRLHNRIYNWYEDGVHLLLRFILGKGTFRNDINDKYILCKNIDNSQLMNTLKPKN